jgi:putative membrane protein
MDEETTFVVTTAGLGVAATGHAALTWGPTAAVRYLAVAISLSFVAEVVVVWLGLLEHHTTPRLLGVPVAALLGWTGVTYLCYRAVTLVVDPAAAGLPAAPLLAAALATVLNLWTDPGGVENGFWTYPPAAVSRLRYRAVPWWNFAGWFVLTGVVTALGAP